MNISCETQYDQKAMTTMAKALRKTIRKKKNLCSHILGWILAAFALFLAFWSPETGFYFILNRRSFITLTLAIVLTVVLVWEDQINGHLALKRLLPGTEKSKTVFRNNEFISSTAAGISTFGYDRVITLAETADYFVFIFSVSHAQVYDKKHFSDGSPEDFRTFIEQVTGKHFIKL